MEQKPLSATGPLEPPSADVAKSYLDEFTAIEQRREDRIDQRMLGSLHMIDGLVIGVLFASALLVMRSDTSVPRLWLLVLLGLVFWMEFSGELRDRLGIRPQWFRSWSLPYLLVLVPTMTIAWASALIDDPHVVLAITPFAISVLVFGVLAVRQWRRAGGQETTNVIAAPERFTRGAAGATAVVGMMLGVLVYLAAGVTEPTVGTAVTAILMVVFLAFTIAVQTSEWMPVLGRIWRWPQWAVLIIAGVLFVVSVVVGAYVQITMTIAVGLGAFVIVLFVVAAAWGIRRSETARQRDAVERNI